MRLSSTFLIPIFLIFSIGFKGIPFAYGSTMPKWKQEIMAIEQQIEELEELKRGYEARVLRHESQGQRLQFRSSEYLTAKRHWELADENRAIANRIQGDIDALQKRKQKIIRRYGKG